MRSAIARGLLGACVAVAAATAGCGVSGTSGGGNPIDAGGGMLGGASGGGISGGAGGAGVTVDAGGNGFGGATGGGGASGTGGTAGGCRVQLDGVAPSSFTTPADAGPGARFRVRATASGVAVARPSWRWTVKFGDVIIPSSVIDDAGTTVDFPIALPGQYQVSAQVVEEPVCLGSRVATAGPPAPATYVLRAIADGFPVQEHRISLGDPQPLALALDPGVNINILPQQPGGFAALASYVRVSSPRTDFSIEGDTSLRPMSALLLSDVSYDVLVIPLDQTAPDLITGLAAEWQSALILDAGLPVTARMRTSDGGAVAGARMILRRGARPSTVGTSDATGAMQLRTRGGMLAASILPPEASGLPQASVGTGADPSLDPGIALLPGATSLDLQMTWDPVVSAALSLTVRGLDGVSVVPGARVRVRSQGAGAPVGTLIVQPSGSAAISLRASGVVDVEVVTDAAGTALFPSLPVGTYDVTIVPATAPGSAVPGAQPPAITSTSVTLARPGLARTVNLIRKVTLSGTLLPVSDSAGARVTAIDRSDTAGGTVASGIVNADGSYSLLVDPVRTYQLVAEPAPGARVTRAVLGTVLTESAGTVVSPRSLPAGRPFLGQLTSRSTPVGGALLQVFCPVLSTRCLDSTFPLATAITRGDGTFDLLLPDPEN